MHIPVDSLLEDLGALLPVTLERYSAPTVDALGDTTSAISASVEIDVVTHQATRQQIERTDLDYGPQSRAFYAREPLKSADGATAPDVIVYDGRRWTIVDSADYAELGGLYLALASLQS